jgi:hypothetical protein
LKTGVRHFPFLYHSPFLLTLSTVGGLLLTNRHKNICTFGGTNVCHIAGVNNGFTPSKVNNSIERL